MICKDCNSENENGLQFCTNCGANLEPETVTEAVAETEETVAATDPGKVLNLISLILGIVSLLSGSICSCLAACVGGTPAALVAVGAIVTGVLGMKKSKEAGFNNKLGLIGMILGIATLAIVLVLIIINAVVGGIGAIVNS